MKLQPSKGTWAAKIMQGETLFNRQSFASPALVGRWTIAGDESGIRVRETMKLQSSRGPGVPQMMQGRNFCAEDASMRERD